MRPAVANVDALVMMAAQVNPVTEPFLIDRVAAIAAVQRVELILVLNKCDLNPADALFDIYRGTGMTVLRVSAKTGRGVEELRGSLSGKLAAFTGNSGVGKSSLLNALYPEAHMATGEVSEKLAAAATPHGMWNCLLAGRYTNYGHAWIFFLRYRSDGAGNAGGAWP